MCDKSWPTSARREAGTGSPGGGFDESDAGSRLPRPARCVGTPPGSAGAVDLVAGVVDDDCVRGNGGVEVVPVGVAGVAAGADDQGVAADADPVRNPPSDPHFIGERQSREPKAGLASTRSGASRRSPSRRRSSSSSRPGDPLTRRVLRRISGVAPGSADSAGDPHKSALVVASVAEAAGQLSELPVSQSQSSAENAKALW